jgi:hypothetical protein
MVAAEEDKVVDRGGPVGEPRDDVMDVAPALGTVTSGEDTVEVPGHDGDT